jgi:hypothetical protein
MRSYVGHRKESESSSESAGNVVDPDIDEGAMAASILYETKNGRLPDRKSHTNPGYDIVSSGAKPSDTRYIEVKGLAGDWNDRGIKLSPTQFQTAQDRGDKFWLYVVENAPHPKQRKLHAICNPFEKVTEYRFDGGWVIVSEEAASNSELTLVEGARVQHTVYKIGTILKVNRHPRRTEVIIDFGVEGVFPLAPGQFEIIDE